MKTVLVTGAGGLLGQKLVGVLAPEWHVVAASHRPFEWQEQNVTPEHLDIAIAAESQRIFEQHSPAVVINAAAYTDVDGAEDHREEAYRANVTGPENLAWLCRQMNIPLVHISTDYLFDGENGPYAEEANPNPLGYYAKTKLWGEEAIIKSGCRYLIVRSNVLYGTAPGVKRNFVLWVIDELQNRRTIRVVSDQYNNPTLADNLAEAIREAVEKGITGLLNIAGSTYLSRHEFALAIAQRFGFDKKLVVPMLTADFKQKAPRPLRGGLRIEKAQKLLATRLLSVPEQLEILQGQLSATRTSPAPPEELRQVKK